MIDPAQDPLDRAVLEELRTILSDDAVRELIDLYLEEAPRMLAAVVEAAGAGDAARLRREAHRLKGSAAGVGARSVEQAARALELAAHAGRCDEGLLAGLGHAHVHTEAALRAWGT